MASLHLVRERCERRTKFPSRKLESRVLSVYTIYKFQIDARFHHDSASMFINRRFRVLFYGDGATKKMPETQFPQTSIEGFFSLKDSLEQCQY